MAGVVAPVLVGFLGLYVGWRRTLFAVGLILVPVFVGVLVFMQPTAPARPQAPLQAHASPRQLISLLSRPGLAMTTVLASLIQFVEVAAFTFLPTILQQYHGLSLALAGTLYTVYLATVALLQPVIGRLSDRFGRTPVVVVLLIAGVVGYGLVARSVSFPILVIAVVLAGIAMTWGAPVQSQFMDHLDDTERGIGFGLVRTAYLLIGAIGSSVVGVVVTYTGWAIGFSLLAGLLGLWLFLLLVSLLLRTARPGSGTETISSNRACIPSRNRNGSEPNRRR